MTFSLPLFGVAAWCGCGGPGTLAETATSTELVAGTRSVVARPLVPTLGDRVVAERVPCGADEANHCDGIDLDCDGTIDEGCGWSGGPLQISAAWSTGADIDLYVVEPNGFRISNLASTSPTGGQLDHDARGACGAGGDTIENVFWASAPPSGEYAVELQYWGACGAAPATDVIVSVAARGQTIGTYRVPMSEGQRLRVLSFSL